MKVPVEVAGEDDEMRPGEQAADTAAPVEDEGAQAAEEAVAADEVEAPHEMTEEEMVEAAKRRGEEAAQREIESDAGRMKAERDKLASELAEAQDEAAQAKAAAAKSADQLMRLQADWENYRTRTARERNEERERAAEKLVVSLLPVLDDMERAIEHAGKAAATDGENTQLDQFVSGIDAVHTKMLGILAKEGVEVIAPVGEAFDPLAHQAVGRVDDATVPDETVAQVYQKGYRMGKKVIRTAMVTVAYGGPKREAPKPDSGDAKGGAEGAASGK